MMRFFLAVAVLFCALVPARRPGAAPSRLRPAQVEVGGYRIAVESISQFQEAARRLAAGEPEPEKPRQRVGIMLRVGAPNPGAGAAVDEFGSEFRAVSDRGQSVTLTSDGTAFNVGGPSVSLETEALDLRARALRSLSGRLRLYPRGEAVRLRLEPQTGAEARHGNGLTARITRFEVVGDRTRLQIDVDWPKQISLRGEADTEAIRVLVETTRGTTFQAGASETAPPAPPGRKRAQVEVQLAGVRSSPRALFVEVAARTGTPVEHSFTLRSVALPLSMTEEGSSSPVLEGGISAPQEVLLNGRPAGSGTLEVGVSAQEGGAWGPWRWLRVSTDERGVADFALPGPGRYRLMRRWRPLDERYARLLEGVRWQPAQVELTAVAGRAARVAPLAATDAPLPPAAGSNLPAFVVPAGNYQVRALQIQERAQAVVNYDLAGPGAPPRPSRSVSLLLEVVSPTADARAALASLVVSGAVGPDGRSTSPVAVDELRPASATQNPRLSVAFRSLATEWGMLRSLEGELLAYPRARAAEPELPLPEAGAGQPTTFRDGDLRFRVRPEDPQELLRYRVELEAPGDAVLALAGDPSEHPVLLDARRQPLRAPLRSPARIDEEGRAVRVSFTQPEAPPAFLRLPLFYRFGQPERRAFRLANLPLPLGSLSR